MKIIADTNVLVRAAVMDDPEEGRLAAALLHKAEAIVVPLPVLCEFVWVLARGYKKPIAEIAESLRRLLNSASVIADRAAAEAGLSQLEAGGDFADGVIAFEGLRMGGKTFATFDREAAKLLEADKIDVHLLKVRGRR